MDWPSVSVVIPARNSSDTIGQTLDSILNQDYGGQIDIVVADGSDSNLMEKYIQREYPQVKILLNPQRIIPSGLNRAVEASGGEIIVRCDAHSILPSNYVRHIVLTLQKDNVMCAGGMAVPVGHTTFGRAVAIVVQSKLGSGNSTYKVGGAAGAVDTVYLGAYHRNTFDLVGYYDESLVANEDYELNWRVRQHGGLVWFLPHLKINYRPRGTWWTWVKQCFGYGRWKSSMLMQNPKSTRPRQLAPPALVAGFVISVATALITSCWVVAIPLVVLYTCVLLIGTVNALIRRPGMSAFMVPVALATLHLAWGLGFFFPARHIRR